MWLLSIGARELPQGFCVKSKKIFKEKGAKTCHLEVRENNVAALNLYIKSGYEKAGLLENYYGNAHGIYLRKPLV
ncbi:MAG: hypothetical protein QHH24_07775 [Candidatus Bathyarchaeota archaeon]|nr:hypothetical protein [Candidatus Bathyarchaeota archaeon]